MVSTLFRYSALSLLLALCVVWTASAQVSIAPTSLFMSERSPYATLTVSNGSDTPQEVTISFRFGYSVTDEEGNLRMEYDVEEHEYAMTENVNAFPRNFMLAPGDRQTVRITARGLGDRQDGTYWTRVSVLASPMSPPVETLAQEAVAARININFEQVIPVFFRRGNVSTGIEVDRIIFEQEGNSGRMVYDIRPTGNSPFSGSVQMRISRNAGQTLIERTSNITAYGQMRRALDIDLSDLDPGEYVAEMVFRSQRRDISQSNLIQIEPVRRTTTFSVE